jgi:hypothetical protein
MSISRVRPPDQRFNSAPFRDIRLHNTTFSISFGQDREKNFSIRNVNFVRIDGWRLGFGCAAVGGLFIIASLNSSEETNNNKESVHKSR